MRLRSADLQGTAQRIEGWLLGSAVQLDDGPHSGGVAGRVDADGRPEFVYLEITGYYLTAMAWLAGGASSSASHAALAIKRGKKALDWLAAVTAGGSAPPTRMHLSNAPPDWRNRARFSFDLAMAARGAACFGTMAGSERAMAIAVDLAARLDELGADGDVLASHVLLDGDDPPDRWSTRPGPHHIKAAAAVLRLPPGVADQRLVQRARRTVVVWAQAMQPSWPCQELHPLLYGLEGLLMVAPSASARTRAPVDALYTRLMEVQAPDGSLPAEMGQPGGTRADVLAQALRVGAILGSAGRSPENHRRQDALAAALMEHVRPDGGVAFSIDQVEANTWCAMFAQQALMLHAQAAEGRNLAEKGADLLV